MAAKISLALAIVAMLGTAALAFLTRGNIDMVKGRLTEAKSSLATSQKSLSDAKSQVKKAEEDVAAANAAAEEQKTLAAKLKLDTEEATRKMADAESKVAGLDKELVELKRGVLVDPNPGKPDAEAVKREIDQAKAELAKAQTELAESKQVQETLTNRMKENDDKLHTVSTEVARYRKGVARTGLSGRIMAVNPGWNFVVLSVGDRHGAAVGASMVVLRDGMAIARAKITSVESSTSIADVIPGSVRKGMSVQPDDTVVYEGERK